MSKTYKIGATVLLTTANLELDAPYNWILFLCTQAPEGRSKSMEGESMCKFLQVIGLQISRDFAETEKNCFWGFFLTGAKTESEPGPGVLTFYL